MTKAAIYAICEKILLISDDLCGEIYLNSGPP